MAIQSSKELGRIVRGVVHAGRCATADEAVESVLEELNLRKALPRKSVPRKRWVAKTGPRRRPDEDAVERLRRAVAKATARKGREAKADFHRRLMKALERLQGPVADETAQREGREAKADFHRRLIELGLMNRTPDIQADRDDLDDQPIDIVGEPLSATVSRERR